LEAIFADPVNGNIEWRKIESLLKTLDCEIIEGNGSRITIIFGDLKATFHRPHPGREALRYRVNAVRDFLKMLGVKP